MTTEELAQAILNAASIPRTMLFAGAGIGVRAGLPDWQDYIEHLADVSQKNGDADSAGLIRKRLKKDQLVAAASVYKTADIPVGERLRHLATPFSRALPADKRKLIEPLFSLPVSAALTTNYDRSLLDGFAKSRNEVPIPLELDDHTLKNGALRTEFCVARIHGRAEKPETMIVDAADYDALDQHPEYLDFLLSVLTQRPCVFVGFSFADPAIAKVLSVFKTKVGPNFPTLHHALLASDASSELRTLLRQTNIKVLEYDRQSNYQQLWAALGIILRDVQKPAGELRPPPLGDVIPAPARSAFERFFAFSYTQLKSRSIHRPLIEISEDGLVSALIHDSGPKGLTNEQLIANVQAELHISVPQAQGLAADSLRRLIASGEVAREGDKLVGTDKSQPVYDKQMATLTSGVLSRMRVREGVTVTTAHKIATAPILEQVFIVRAWDLAAHYAGAAGGIAADLPAVIEQLAHEYGRKQLMGSQDALVRSIVDLLQFPTPKESQLLTELGRTAFALQLVLSSPRQSLSQRYSLPQRVYFDANVLLPAITPGHPLSAAYNDAINRLQAASKAVGNICEMVVALPFLNEIISHRQLAIDTVRTLGLEAIDELAKHVLFYGATNINVFIGAYSTAKEKEPKLKFHDFLMRVAPYTDVVGLAAYMHDRGITALDLTKLTKRSAFNRIFGGLISGYEHDQASIVRPKEKILIHHEAAQLTLLQIDISDRLRTVFVTADLRLQRIVQTEQPLRHLVGAILSQVGFVGLVDIMVGLEADNRSIARLIWGIPRTNAQQAIRDYLIRRAVDQYNAVLLMAVPRVVDEIAAEAAKDAAKLKIDLTSGGHDASDAARAGRFIDQVEDRFYDSMANEIERMKEQTFAESGRSHRRTTKE